MRLRSRQVNSSAVRSRRAIASQRPARLVEALEPRALLAAIAWDGDGGDGDWHNPLNWVGDVVPGDGDDVTIGFTLGSPIFIDNPAPVRIASLDLSAPMSVYSPLDVTDRTTIADVAFLVDDAEVSTANLTLAPGGAPVTNVGTWTISGDSTIARQLSSARSFLVADGATLTFLPGAGGGYGRVIAVAGTLSVGSRALVDGLGAGYEHIHVVDLLSLGAGAIVQETGIVVVGTAEGWNRAGLEGLGLIGAALVNVSLDLDWTNLRGTLAIANSVTIARNGVSAGDLLRLDAGELHVKGRLSGSGSTQIRGAAVFLGDDTIEGSAFLFARTLSVERSTLNTLENAFVYGTISDSTITGAPTLHADVLGGCIISAESTVIVSELVRASPDAKRWWLEPLVEDRALDVHGRLIFGGDDVRWTEGTIRLMDEGSRLIRTATGGMLVSGRMGITGLGQVINKGTFEAGPDATLNITVDVTSTGTILAEGVLGIYGVLDSPGTMAAANGGVVTLIGDILQIDAQMSLTDGTWMASDGGSLRFDEPVRRNNASIVVTGDATLPGLQGLRRNNGTITLNGAGAWIDGSQGAIDLVNNGTITKLGYRARTIVGSIRQTVRGVLEVPKGRLILDGSLDNAGIVRIGLPGNYGHPPSAPARLRLTGDFDQTGRGMLTFLGRLGPPVSSYPRLIANQLTFHGRVLIDLDPPSPGSTPLNGSVRLAVGSEPRAGEFDTVGLSVASGAALLKYTPTGFRVRLIP